MALGDLWEAQLETQGKNSRAVNVLHFREVTEGTGSYLQTASDLALAIIGTWISEAASLFPVHVSVVCCTARRFYPNPRELITIFGTGSENGEIVGGDELPMGSAGLVAKHGHTATQQGRVYVGLLDESLESDGVLSTSAAQTLEAYVKALLVDIVEGNQFGTMWVGGIKHTVAGGADPPTMWDIDYVSAKPAISSQRRRRNPHVPYSE